MGAPDLTGMKFGQLTVLRLAEPKNEKRRWECQCSCGKITVVTTDHVKSGHTASCGCLKSTGKAYKHGMSRSRLYQVWESMKQRCLNPRDAGFKNYGGRGIKICDRWRYGEDGWTGFECFISDMGFKPTDKHSIDRINNNSNYEPGNCRWALPSMQVRNRRPLPPVTLETKAKMSASAKVRRRAPHSLETRTRISNALKGRTGKPHSLETRARMSASHKARFEMFGAA
jgi:hypothetical protein